MTAFDLPGHGRSGPWDETSPEQCDIQHLTARIAETFLDEPKILIGHSFGAMVALRLALERPDLVRSLVLIEPVFFAVAKRDAYDIWAEHQARKAQQASLCEPGDLLAAARNFGALWGGSPWENLPPSQREAMAARMPLISATQSALHEDPEGWLDGGLLERLAKPVLLIEGSESPPVIGAIHEGLAKRFPDVRRAVIAGAAHMIPLTHPDQTALEILSFL
jgi:pimeloyl-ACP methyl ester carboxylesterase